MTSRGLRMSVGLACLVAVFAGGPAQAGDPRTIRGGVSRVASGLSSPVALAAPKDGTGRIFIVEQAGRIRVRTKTGTLLSTPFLDIRGRVLDGGERGLLGLAFHPSYKTNGYFFVAYTDGSGDVRVSRYRAGPPSANRASTTEVIFMDIPHRTYSNHNGGQVAFGRDGYLYVGIGDGGGAGDPGGNAQKLSTWLGKILRIDVNSRCSGKNYCIPSTNPFATSSTAKREIWHRGLRNPWRFSFDRSNGTQYIADVGEKAREEVNVTSNGTGRRNYGWDCREGTLNTVSTFGGSYCSGKTFTSPVYQYSHSSGRCAIVGGHVYRGSAYTVMSGMYTYADYCTGEIWAMAKQSSGTWISSRIYDHSSLITTFGEAENGELYIADTGGRVYRLSAVRR